MILIRYFEYGGMDEILYQFPISIFKTPFSTRKAEMTAIVNIFL